MAIPEISKAPAFTVTAPDGKNSRQEIHQFPFRIGRQSGNHLILRDPRASRNHAHLIVSEGDYVIEDLDSRHGIFINGERAHRAPLRDGDRIEFGVPDSYELQFHRPGSRVAEIAERFADTALLSGSQAGNLTRLKAILQVSRALQTSFTVDGVLAAVVDAALVITGAERGFLFLKRDGGLQLHAARDRNGNLAESDLEVPRHLLQRILEERSQTFSRQFDAADGDSNASVHALSLKSIVCIPLVRVQMGATPPESLAEALGLLYLDARDAPRDMADGNRELLESLGIEASVVLENARLLEEDRVRRHIEEELAVARSIQESLLPAELPETGWLRALGSSSPSHQVGGDYYDLIPLPSGWVVVVADISGKGVSAALAASLLQGAFLGIDGDPHSLGRILDRLHHFFHVRTGGCKYATVFCALIEPSGVMSYINAGHCAPILVSMHRASETLDATSSPVGLLAEESFECSSITLAPGDRLVIYTDGVTESRDASGEYFGADRLKDFIFEQRDRPAALLQQAILEELDDFTAGREQDDDRTLVVLGFQPD